MTERLIGKRIFIPGQQFTGSVTVYERILPQVSLRFLLADDPGAGKTIMAGLLLKELKLRNAVERVLILAPAPLTLQWQDEARSKFSETFEVINSILAKGYNEPIQSGQTVTTQLRSSETKLWSMTVCPRVCGREASLPQHSSLCRSFSSGTVGRKSVGKVSPVYCFD